VEDYDQERDERLVADLSARLRRACAHLSDEQFGALVRDIARVTVRFHEIEANPLLLRPVQTGDLPVALPPPVVET
jgi:hypothetical protein